MRDQEEKLIQTMTSQMLCKASVTAAYGFYRTSKEGAASRCDTAVSASQCRVLVKDLTASGMPR
jgi:hypothetical protein